MSTIGWVKKKVFLTLNYLGAKNENIAKNRSFCEKIRSLGQFLDIPQMYLNSEKYFFWRSWAIGKKRSGSNLFSGM